MALGALALQANSTGSVIGSMVLVAATGGTIAACIRLTGRRPRDGGAPMSGWGRAAITIVVTLAVSAAVGGTLTAVGLGVDEADATTELRDTLADRGYAPAEVDCVEAGLVRHYGSVDAVEDAEDVKPAFVAIVSCSSALGLDPAVAGCWADAIVDHFGIEQFDAAAFVDIGDDLHDPADGRFLTIASMTCQGLSEQQANCIYDEALAADPDMFGDRDLGQTPAQQRMLVDVARRCAGG